MKKYALITGASSGIGREFAHIFAQNKTNLVLIARSTDTLESIKNELQSKYNIDIHIIGLDLSKIESTQLIFDYTEKQQLEIEYLINNA
jgi:short-subunit dehydrogenase